MMRAALYIRATDNSKAAPGRYEQLKDLRVYSSTLGWNVAEEFTEGAYRARGARKAFQALLKAASNREFEVVLFWSLERFCPENLTSTLHHLQTLSSYGVHYRSFSEPFLDSSGPHRDAVLGTIALIAAHERRRRSDKIREGLEDASEKGRRGGRPTVIVDLQRLYQLRLEDYSLEQIAKELETSKTTIFRLAHKQDEDIKSGIWKPNLPSVDRS
jgi:DNA invertase Pin-like site-specific DNA recombinase